MADPAKTVDQNLLPVQAYFDVYGNFQTFIGQGQPFYATINPIQSGLTITNSTIDSTTIGATTPSTGVFTNISATTGQINTSPINPADIANKLYVDTIAQGLNPKGACKCATLSNITLSGLQTIDGYTTLAGNRVLVKNQTNTPDNGIYVASSGAWTRATDMDVWAEVPGAYTVVLNGSQANTAWVSTSADTGTIGTTPITFVQFSGNAAYYAGTGLTLSSNTFSITNTAVTAGSYGSASSVPVFTVNAQGQLTAASNTSIAIAASQITSGTIASSLISGSYTGITGVGVLNSGTWNATPIANAYLANSSLTVTAGTGLSGGGLVSLGGSVSLSNAGVLSNIGGTGISVSGATGNVTITNTGVTSLTGGTGISVSGSTGGVTVTNTLPMVYPATGIPYSTGSAWGTSYSTSGTGTVIALTAGPTISNIVLTNNVTATSSGQTINFSPIGSVTISPTGGVTISPTSLTINPGTGTINNVSIGATTASTGAFTTLSASSLTLSSPLGLSYGGTNASLTAVAGGIVYSTASALAITSAGTSGQVLTSNGTGAPTWTNPTAYATVTDDTTTNGTRYPLFANQTSGNIATEYTSSTKLQYNPSTGTFTATAFSGSGASLTSLTAGNLTGTIPSTVLGNSSLYIGTTAVPLNSASGSITSLAVNISGNAATATSATSATNATNVAITDTTSSSSTWYPTIVSTTTGNLPVNTSSTKLSFVPNTGNLTATTFTGFMSVTAGTTTTAPIQLSAGTNLTSATQGAIEFDGNLFYITGNTSTGNGRQLIETSQIGQLATSATVASGGQFFTSTVRPYLIANNLYHFRYTLLFTKATAGTVTFGFSNSASTNFAPLNAMMTLVQTTYGTTQTYNAYATGATTANFQATFSLADATTYSAVIEGDVICSASTRLQLTVTDSAGTITSLLGSNFVITDLGTTNIGNIG